MIGLPAVGASAAKPFRVEIFTPVTWRKSPAAAACANDANAAGRTLTRLELLLLVVVLLFLALKFYLATRINIHWDEFYFLSLVHESLRGELASRMQSFHVHLFAWLPLVARDEIDEIVLGRLVMAVLGVGSAALIYRLARQFLSRVGALFGLAAYLSLTAVTEHGASFRADPLVTFLSLGALCLVLCSRRRLLPLAVAAASMALAFLVTVKSVFYLAVIGLTLLAVRGTARARLQAMVMFGVAFIGALAALFALHAAGLAPPAVATATYLQGTARKVLLEEGLLPRWEELLYIVAANPLFFLMTANGLAIAWQRRKSGDVPAFAGWLPLALNLPLLAPIVYRNAFAYCYVFLLPMAAIPIGLAFERHWPRLTAVGKVPGRLLVLLFLALQTVAISAGVMRLLPDRIAPQRAVLAAARSAFPDPVGYIDGYGVLAGYRRFGFFMSSWGLDQYRAVGAPVFPALVESEAPPLLLADSLALYHALVPGIVTDAKWQLLPQDQAFLAANYVQHWGIVFVAGKKLTVDAGMTSRVDISIAGSYRLEGEAPVAVDGHSIVPGETIMLTRGSHEVTAAATGPLVMRWAAAGPAPTATPVDLPTFFGGGPSQ